MLGALEELPSINIKDGKFFEKVSDGSRYLNLDLLKNI